ncbi:MAG: hypothetical protein GC154_02065 [bacterium]|nr:hypothetical protein [bacterium]
MKATYWSTRRSFLMLAAVIAGAAWASAQPSIGPMVEISAKIFEFRYDTETQFGIFYQFNSDDSALQDSDVFLHGTENPSTDAPIGALDLSGSFAKLSYGSIDFNVKAAIDEGWGTVISNPTLTTANGITANIHSGEQIPYTTVQVKGTRTTLALEEKPTGISLNVTPYIMPGNNVLLDLEISSNDVVRFVVFDRGDGQRYELPVISSRTVQTVVIIPSGQRFYIGGLYSRTTGDITRKVPIVGDLPVIGFFLRGFNKKRGTSETMFQITPTIRAPGAGLSTQLTGFDKILGDESTKEVIIEPPKTPSNDASSGSAPPQSDDSAQSNSSSNQTFVPEIPKELIESATGAPVQSVSNEFTVDESKESTRRFKPIGRAPIRGKR